MKNFDDLQSDDFDSEFAPTATHADDDLRADFTDTVRPTFDEPCKKCGGRGMYHAYSGRTLGACFACKGKGFLTRFTSPEARAKSRASAARRAEKNADQNWESFKAEHADVAEWIQGSPSFEFAVSMGEAVRKYGDLTERQLAAAMKCVAKRATKAAVAAARAESSPAVEVDRLLKAFAAARGAGVARPRLNLGAYTFKPAPLSGNNPGAIYVTENGGDTYLGKVISGKFQATRACDDATREQVALAVNDPRAAAIAFGLRTGTCAICSRTLTNGESIERGIGPICASRFGW